MGVPARSTAEHPQNVLRWVHAPQQARTRAGLNALLDAAERLVSVQGFDETGIAEIAREAGSSVGSFYRRFRDKDGMLQALHGRFCDEARITADAALDPERWVDSSLEEVVTAFTAFLVDIYRERTGMLRAFLVRGFADETVRERTADLLTHLTDGLRTILEMRSAEFTHPAGADAAAFSLRIITGTLNQTLQLSPNALSLDDPSLSVETARAVKAYLGATTSPTSTMGFAGESVVAPKH